MSVTDRPILFSAAMVRALFAGRKSQTRRLSSSPLGKCCPGDRLWVREAFTRWTGGRFHDYAVACDYDKHVHRFHTGIHLPRKLSRLTLVVTEVRHQRLHDITEADALAEGCNVHPSDILCPVEPGRASTLPWQVEWFRKTWIHLHSQRPYWQDETWDTNPEVVAITFTVHRANIDRLAAPEVANAL